MTPKFRKYMREQGMRLNDRWEAAIDHAGPNATVAEVISKGYLTANEAIKYLRRYLKVPVSRRMEKQIRRIVSK